jgi:hypothetical protein
MVPANEARHADELLRNLRLTLAAKKDSRMGS